MMTLYRYTNGDDMKLTCITQRMHTSVRGEEPYNGRWTYWGGTHGEQRVADQSDESVGEWQQSRNRLSFPEWTVM